MLDPAVILMHAYDQWGNATPQGVLSPVICYQRVPIHGRRKLCEGGGANCSDTIDIRALSARKFSHAPN